MAMASSARLTSLGVMASALAHEINNPLSIISMGVEQLDTLLQDPAANGDRIAQVSEAVARNVMRIKRIVRGLRRLSRDGAHDGFKEVQAGAIILDTVELCRARFSNHGIALEVGDIPEDLPVECRATQVAQVLLNLLNNAHDAVREAQEKRVRIEVEDMGDAVAFSVLDNGSGIPPELHERVMEPFFTTKEDGAGMGLGLSISRSIIESHDGTLRVDNDCDDMRFVAQIPKKHKGMPSNPIVS